MKRLAIIGSGDLGQQIAYHATQDNQFTVVGFFDDFKNRGVLVNDIPILGGLSDVSSQFKKGIFDELLIGIGYKHMMFRSDVFNKFKAEIPFAKLIHSNCLIDPSCIIQAGVVIYPGCIVDQNVNIGENVLVNVGCCIAHDSKIGKHSFLSPRVAIAGFVTIENSCIIGINATIIDNIKIVQQVQIGGGSIVIKNIEKAGLYVGNPARFIR